MRIVIDAFDDTDEVDAELWFEDAEESIIVSFLECDGIYRRFHVDMLQWAKLVEGSRGFMIERSHDD